MAMQRKLTLLRDETEESGTVDEQTIRIACATSDLKKVDQHFGSAERFAIYEVGPEGHSLLQVVEFGKLAQDGNENKLLEKFVALEGTIAVYCLAVGPSAVRQLTGLGIQPIKVEFGSPINKLLQGLEQELQEGPTGWLARALEARQEKSASRFDEMEAEGWDEC